MLHLTTLIYICLYFSLISLSLSLSLSLSPTHTHTHICTCIPNAILPVFLYILMRQPFFFLITCHSKWIIEFCTFVNGEKNKRKTIYVVFKARI